jgi:hypothetical protein
MSWRTNFEAFNTQVEQIDLSVKGLIDRSFQKNLSSSESAFDLLAKFQNIRTRK